MIPTLLYHRFLAVSRSPRVQEPYLLGIVILFFLLFGFKTATHLMNSPLFLISLHGLQDTSSISFLLFALLLTDFPLRLILQNAGGRNDFTYLLLGMNPRRSAALSLMSALLTFYNLFLLYVYGLSLVLLKLQGTGLPMFSQPATAVIIQLILFNTTLFYMLQWIPKKTAYATGSAYILSLLFLLFQAGPSLQAAIYHLFIRYAWLSSLLFSAAGLHHYLLGIQRSYETPVILTRSLSGLLRLPPLRMNSLSLEVLLLVRNRRTLETVLVSLAIPVLLGITLLLDLSPYFYLYVLYLLSAAFSNYYQFAFSYENEYWDLLNSHIPDMYDYFNAKFSFSLILNSLSSLLTFIICAYAGILNRWIFVSILSLWILNNGFLSPLILLNALSAIRKIHLQWSVFINYEGSSLQNQTGYMVILFSPLILLYFLSKSLPAHILPLIPAIIGLPGLFNRKKIIHYMLKLYHKKYKYSIPR